MCFILRARCLSRLLAISLSLALTFLIFFLSLSQPHTGTHAHTHTHTSFSHLSFLAVARSRLRIHSGSQLCCIVLQCVVACCSVLQCIAVCCSVLQCVAVCCVGAYHSGSRLLSLYLLSLSLFTRKICTNLAHCNTLQHTADLLSIYPLSLSRVVSLSLSSHGAMSHALIATHIHTHESCHTHE